MSGGCRRICFLPFCSGFIRWHMFVWLLFVDVSVAGFCLVCWLLLVFFFFRWVFLFVECLFFVFLLCVHAHSRVHLSSRGKSTSSREHRQACMEDIPQACGELTQARVHISQSSLIAPVLRALPAVTKVDG